jgi:gluconolactonase
MSSMMAVRLVQVRERKATVDVDEVVPGFDRFVSPHEEFDWFGSGYGGVTEDGIASGAAEGPVWIPERNSLVFSDNANSKRYIWSEATGVSLLRDDTNDANGFARDLQGRIIACEHAARRVTREELDGTITVVAPRMPVPS